eukprot:gene15838-19091_t
MPGKRWNSSKGFRHAASSLIGMAPQALNVFDNVTDKGLDVLDKSLGILDKTVDIARQALGQIDPQAQDQPQPPKISQYKKSARTIRRLHSMPGLPFHSPSQRLTPGRAHLNCKTCPGRNVPLTALTGLPILMLELKNSLSVKLLRVVLLSALAVGVVLSAAQIVFDAYKTRQAVAGDAQRILDMFRDPSTQAVYSLDREMGMQVIEGLFQDDAVRMASIGHPNETMLAEKTRDLQQSPSRWLTDLILGQERTFTTPLVGRGPYSEYYGDLSITLDTATYGKGFLVSSVIIFISGVLRALAMGLVLYLVYHWLLTKPLSRIIEHLSSINPDRPSEHKIPQLKGHEKNELGLWINTANQLLESIERNTHLRHEAEN